MNDKAGGLGSAIEYIPVQITAPAPLTGDDATNDNVTVEANPPTQIVAATATTGYVVIQYSGTNLKHVVERGDNGGADTNKIDLSDNKTHTGKNLSISGKDNTGVRKLTVLVSKATKHGTIVITASGGGKVKTITVDVVP